MLRALLPSQFRPVSAIGCFESNRHALRISGAGILGAVLLSVAARAQVTERVSVDSSGTQGDAQSMRPTSSADGKVIAFDSIASNLVADDTNGRRDCFVRDRVGGTTVRVSVSSSGGEADRDSSVAVISADGTVVAFVSLASNLVSNDGDHADVFVHDLASGVTELVSVDSSGAAGNDHSGYDRNWYFEYYDPPSLSADGRYVAFSSLASNLVSGDTNSACDVFVHDRVTGITERVSVDSAGVEGAAASDRPSISADGNLVAFSSASALDSAFPGLGGIFVRDRLNATTTLVNISSSGTTGDGSPIDAPAISADGNFVAWADSSSNLVAGDTNGKIDIFVHDRSTGVTERVSVATSGTQAEQSCLAPSISSDGSLVAFNSQSSNLVLGDRNGWSDVFVRDRTFGITRRVSVDSSGAEGHGDSRDPSISADGATVAFDSWAADLVPDDTNDNDDVFFHDRGIPAATWSNYGAGFPGRLGVPAFTSLTDPKLGTTVTLDLGNSAGSYTVGALFVGLSQASIPSTWGGELLVDPQITELIGLTPWGASLFGDLPDDDLLLGIEIDLQAIELDPGAAKGISFTPGLQLMLGR